MRIAHRINFVLLILVISVMPFLTFAFLVSNLDGQRIEFGLSLTAEQEQELARMIGFELAPGESFGFSWYGYNTYAKHEDYLHINLVDDGYTIKGPEGAPVLALAKKFVARNSIGARFVFALAYVVPIGWLSVPTLITAQFILRRKAKKEKIKCPDPS